jgi:N-acetylglucosamine kinase-like BadF-type ATPase
MRVLDPGHRYALDNLETEGGTILQFRKDPALHDGDGYEGPSCQEVLRAVIDRVQELNREKPDIENAIIIHDLRHAIAAFEARALRRRVEKDGLEIEKVPVDTDGHLLLAKEERDEDGAVAARQKGG